MNSVNRSNRSRFKQLGAIVAAVICLAVTPAQAKTLKWAFQGDPVSMDPYTINETLTLGYLNNVYEGLVRYGRQMVVEPALATEWTNTKPDVWRFKLRQNVKFHDGTPFTADDVLFSWKRIASKGSDVKTFVAGIKDIKKIDDMTIDIITDGPRPIFTREIVRWYIMSESWAVKNKAVEVGELTTGEENYANRHANGTGPFMLKSRAPGIKTVLVAAPNWWDKPEHNVSEAILTPIKSAATRVASLLSGELDMMYPVPTQDAARIRSTKGLRMLEGPEARTIFLGMDLRRDELLYSNIKGKNPLKDVRVRKAMYQAIDMEAIKKKVMRGNSWPTALMIAPQINGFDKSLNERYPYDPKMAKKLLTDAGYGDGFEIVLDCPNDRYVNDEAICQAIAAMEAKVGIKVKLNAQTKAKHFGKIKSEDTSFYLLGWTPETFDAHNVFYNNVKTRPAYLKSGKPQPGQGQWNCGNYSNPEVDKLIERIANEVDDDKRQTMISRMMSIHKEEIGHIPLHQQPLSWGVKSNVDLYQAPDNTFSLRFVTVN
jgi:peptide/nickel transport system substrate-binding protein